MTNTGGPFEIEVRDLVQASINAGELGIDPKLAKVKLKEKYWSAKRDDHIITDVSVELYRSGQADYWFLWVIECKDLGKLVPVDDVEEFAAKMAQINAHKGSMATRRGFSKGCTTYAKNSGIGLFRLTPAGQKLVLNENSGWNFVATDFVEGAPEKNLPGHFAGVSDDGKESFSSKVFVTHELRAAIDGLKE